MTAVSDFAITHDTILGGRLKLAQPAKGHRAGTDAVLLAAATPVTTGLLIDAGAGIGTAGLAVALRDSAVQIVLLEREPVLAELARENCAANCVSNRAVVAEADVLSYASRRRAGLENGTADLVLTNPPFYAPGKVRPSPNSLRTRAHVLEGSLEDWLIACLALLNPSGILVMIAPPTALPTIFDTLGSRCGAMTIRPIYPRREQPAIRVLATARLGSNAPPEILPGFVLHDDAGAFTPEAADLHGGQLGTSTKKAGEVAGLFLDIATSLSSRRE